MNPQVAVVILAIGAVIAAEKPVVKAAKATDHAVVKTTEVVVVHPVKWLIHKK